MQNQFRDNKKEVKLYPTKIFQKIKKCTELNWCNKNREKLDEIAEQA